jgi:hypothetical protein
LSGPSAQARRQLQDLADAGDAQAAAALVRAAEHDRVWSAGRDAHPGP